MKKIKYIGRIVIRSILLLLLLLCLILAGIQLKPVKSYVFNRVLFQVNQLIEGELSAEISGNLFTELQLNNIFLTQKSDTLFATASIELEYQLLPLLRQEIQIKHLAIHQPRVKMKQLSDSSWNFEHLIQQNNSPEKQETTSTSEWIVSLINVELINGSLQSQSTIKQLPNSIDSLNIRAIAKYEPDKLYINLKKAKFISREPALKLKNLSFISEINDSVSRLNELVLETKLNRIHAQGYYKTTPPHLADVSVLAKNFDSKEFEAFTSYAFPAKPSITIEGKMKDSLGNIKMLITNEAEHFSLLLRLTNFEELMGKKGSKNLSYTATLLFDQFNLAAYLDTSFSEIRMNGKMQLNGHGMDETSNQVSIVGELHESTYDDFLVDKLNFEIQKSTDSLFIDTNIESDFGAFQLSSTANDIFGDFLHQGRLLVHEVNAGQIVKDTSYNSNLSFDMAWTGRGIDSSLILNNVTMYASPSVFADYYLDTLMTAFNYGDQKINILQLRGETKGIAFDADGYYHLEDESELSLNAAVKNLHDLAFLFPDILLSGEGSLRAKYTGTSEQFKATVDSRFSQLQYDSIMASGVLFHSDILVNNEQVSASGQVNSAQIVYDDIKLDTLDIKYRLLPDSLYSETYLANSLINGFVAGGVKFADTSRLRLSAFELNGLDQSWSLDNNSGPVSFSDNYIDFQRFKLKSDYNNTQQSIFIDGKFDTKSSRSMNLDIRNLDIQPIADFIDTSYQIKGILSSDMEISYDSVYPYFKGEVQVDNIAYNSMNLGMLRTQLAMEDGQVNFDIAINPQTKGKINLEGKTYLLFDSGMYSFILSDSASVFAMLSVDSLDLAPFTNLSESYKSSGMLNGAMILNGTRKNPLLSGQLAFKQGLFNMPEYGVDYKKIAMLMRADSNQFSIDSLQINTEEGQLKGEARLTLSDGLFNEHFTSNLDLQLSNFQVVNHKQFNTQISGPLTLNGNENRFDYSGDLIINESEIVLPAILNLFGETPPPDLETPILVREMKKKQSESEAPNTSVETLVLPENKSNFSDSIFGSVKFAIPGNTWIKQDGMHIELAGDLSIVKDKAYFEIFGNIDVRRGEYDLLGRTFKIKEGNLIFQGGEDMLPIINLNAEYVFRDADRLKQNLNVQISGKADQPEISFKLNGDAINEGDALSYLIFGKHPEQLSLQQKEEVSENATLDMATKAASSLLSSQLTKLLGNQLNFDYIEVAGNEDLSGGNVSVGTYLTNDLFISYDQYFGEINEKDIDKYEVILEYELLKFLFLQLNNSSSESGFDLILKNSK